jgi:hypothetical protein
VLLGDSEEHGGDDVSGDRGVGGAAEQVAGVVVEPVEHFDVGAVGQAPVGEVGLPAFVGLSCGEAVVGGAGSLAWLGGDEAGGVQDAPDGRGGGWPVAFLFEVPGDGHGAVVEALLGQLQP